MPWPQQVMLARPVEELPGPGEFPGGCLFEPKWDGFRGVLHVRSDVAGEPVCRVQSRRGSDLSGAFPDIAAAAAAQLPAGTVVDGELVIWTADRLDFAALQRRMTALSRAARLASGLPATFLVFDVLAYNGNDWREKPLRERRRLLDDLRGLAPPLQVSPATEDRGLAAEWLRSYHEADVGIEGLVIKGLGDSYQPGRRGWLKLRTRHSADAVVGAVTGTLTRPERLILGLYDATGALLIAGGTAPLTPLQQRQLASFLQPAAQGQHPWPADLPIGRTGPFGGGQHLPVVLVRPTLVVEVSADTAFEYGRWRHLVRYLRVRPDLDPAETTLRS